MDSDHCILCPPPSIPNYSHFSCLFYFYPNSKLHQIGIQFAILSHFNLFNILMGNSLMQALAAQSMPQPEHQSAPQMPYLTYLNFAEHIVGLLCQLATIFAVFLLLSIYNLRPHLLRVKTLSRSMLFYLSLHLICSLLGIPHLIYKVFWWQPLQPGAPSVYSPYLLYWTGLPELSYMALAPLPVFFLILDRCLALRMANSAQQGNIWLFWASLLSAFAVYSASWGIYLAELPLDLAQVSSCELASCEMRKYRNILQLSLKMIFGTANVLFSLLFLYLLDKSGKAKNLKNRVVKYTIILEIAFNVIPGYSAVAFNIITGIPSSAFVGEFALVFCAMDAAICSLIYLKLFLRQKPNSVIPTQIVRGINTSTRT